MIETLADLVEVKATVLRELRPNDVLILRHQDCLSDTAQEYLRSAVEKVFPGQRVLILEEGLDLEVMRKGDADVEEPV